MSFITGIIGFCGLLLSFLFNLVAFSDAVISNYPSLMILMLMLTAVSSAIFLFSIKSPFVLKREMPKGFEKQ